jgi:quinol monooxygenase YgiN
MLGGLETSTRDPYINLLWLRALCCPYTRPGLDLPVLIRMMRISSIRKASMSISGTSMVIAIVNIKASSGKYGELREALFSLSGPTEAEAGCKSCQLYQGVSDECALRIETRWATQADLLRHIRSDGYKKLLLLMELGSEQPTVEFYTVSELRGLDLIRDARTNLTEKLFLER